MDRAISTFEIRSVNAVERTFVGVANSSSVDSHGTVIEPNGAVYSLPISLFFHTRGLHDHGKPIGDVVRTWIQDGLRWVECVVKDIPDDGTVGGRSVKERVDAAWADIKNGLVRGLSIDFLPIDPPNPNATRWTKWRWLGLTVVPLPSNYDATVRLVRSVLAESGDLPGVSGNPSNIPRTKMTIIEQIQQHENSRAAKVARRTALMERAGSDARTLAEDEAEEYDNLASEVEQIDAHLTRLTSLRRDNERSAVPVNGTSPATGSVSRSPEAPQSRGAVPVVRIKPNTIPGLGMARYAMALGMCRGNRYEAAEYARRTFGDNADEVVAALQGRAAIAAGTTTDATWAAPLVQTTYLQEFLELLTPMTLIGRIPGITRVPFNISMPAETGGLTFGWVGQGVAKPLTKGAFTTVTLGTAKAAGIVVLTQELVRSSSPSAQVRVRDIMLRDMSTFLSEQLVDIDVDEVSNVSPASITFGVSPTSATGTTDEDYWNDISELVGGFADDNFGLSGVVLLMSEGRAFRMGGIRNVVGGFTFPGLGANGGDIRDVQVIGSNIAPLQHLIVAVHAPSILVADDGGTEIDVSDQATLQMDSEPDNPTSAGTVLVSLWQRNLVGLRAERWINWKRARTGAVRVLDYGGS